LGSLARTGIKKELWLRLVKDVLCEKGKIKNWAMCSRGRAQRKQGMEIVLK
jgi:hypothetical protein